MTGDELARVKRMLREIEPHERAAWGEQFLSDLDALIREVEAGRWQPIESAPRDGTRILIWFRHAHAAYSKDPIGEGWEAVHEAQWIKHNGGGWTWHGLAGEPIKWQPLPAIRASGA